jgi:hypothetical protein
LSLAGRSGSLELQLDGCLRDQHPRNVRPDHSRRRPGLGPGELAVGRDRAVDAAVELTEQLGPLALASTRPPGPSESSRRTSCRTYTSRHPEEEGSVSEETDVATLAGQELQSRNDPVRAAPGKLQALPRPTDLRVNYQYR